MSLTNSYYNFVNSFVPNTTVKSAAANAQFGAVQAGFTAVEAASKSSLKVAGYSSSTAITATPNSFLMLNASGTPYASQTLSFSPNFGGNKLQNIGAAVAATDAITYGQAQTLINTAAYGSPTVVTLPSLTGNALKTLRVNAGGVATEWAYALPTSTNVAEYLYSVSSAPTWGYGNGNLIGFSSGNTLDGFTRANFIGNTGPIGAKEISNSGHSIGTTGDLAVTSAACLATATPGTTYTASCLFACNSSIVAANTALLMRFLDASKTPISETSVGYPYAADSVRRRFSLTYVAPALTAYIQTGIVSFDVISTGQSFFASKFKVEVGSTPTPWTDDATEYQVSQYMGVSQHFYDASTGRARVRIGANATSAASLELMGAGGPSSQASATLKTRLESVLEGKGALDVFAKRITFNGVAGYNALVVNGALGATPTIDLMAGAKQNGSLSANAVITLTAPPSDIFFEAKLFLKQDATGGRTATFSSSATIVHVGGTALAPQTAANSETVYNITWDGARFIVSGYYI